MEYVPEPEKAQQLLVAEIPPTSQLSIRCQLLPMPAAAVAADVKRRKALNELDAAVAADVRRRKALNQLDAAVAADVNRRRALNELDEAERSKLSQTSRLCFSLTQ